MDINVSYINNVIQKKGATMRHISLVKWVLALVTVLTLSISACAPTPEPTSPSTPTMVATPSPSATRVPMTTPVTEASPTPSLSPNPSLPDGCDAPTELSRPAKVQAGNIEAKKVQSLPLTSDGALPAPLNDSPDEFAWWNESGKLGEDEVETILTAHTYSKRQDALGNLLQDTLEQGSLIRATGADGQTYCYEVVERLEVSAADDEGYDVRQGGQMTIIVCSGYEEGVWTKRTFFRATLVK